MSEVRIDAHQHFWQIGHHGQVWPDAALPAIHRDFVPQDLTPELAAHGITRTVLVQSQPSDADTEWLIELAADAPMVGAVVGWVDVKAAGVGDRIAALAGRPKLRGLRPMLQELPAGWILDPAATPALVAMRDAHLVFDALIRPHHLADIAALADAYPTLDIVIDHAAKPGIVDGEIADWAAAMRDVADRPNVVCKLSGLATEASPDWSRDELAPYVDVLLRCFGTERLLWGSDWPVLLLAGSYDKWVEVTASLLKDLSEPERSAILGGNAARIYRIR